MNNGFKPLDILQALYDSEINVSISWLWDGGVDWKIFAPAEEVISGNAWTAKEAVKQLTQAAIKHFPDSDFTKKFTTLGRD